MSIKLPVTEHVFPQSGAVFHCHQDSPIYCFCLTAREIGRIAGSDRKDGCNLKDPTASDSQMGAQNNQSHFYLVKMLLCEVNAFSSHNLLSFQTSASSVLFHWTLQTFAYF